MGSRKQRRQDEQKQKEDRSKNLSRWNTDIRKEPSPDGDMGWMAGRETVDQMGYLIFDFVWTMGQGFPTNKLIIICLFPPPSVNILNSGKCTH